MDTFGRCKEDAWYMKKIDFTPESILDLQKIKAYVEEKFGEKVADSVIKRIVNSIETLQALPDSGIDMLARYGINTDYLCLITNGNYVFYRNEYDIVKIIRVLNEKQDFLYILFGIKTTSQETEDYWGE